MKAGRKSNIELLRIISMLLIIAGHFTGQSEVLKNIGETVRKLGHDQPL